VTRPVERAASLSDEGSTFRKLLESRCPEESNLHRTVPRMGTRLMQHGSGDNSLNRSVKGESNIVRIQLTTRPTVRLTL